MAKLAEGVSRPGAARPAPGGSLSWSVSLISRLSLLLLSILIAGCGLNLNINPNTLSVSEIDLPAGGRQLSFGDITYDEVLDRVIVPAGDAGLFLIDPENPGEPTVIPVPGEPKGTGAGFVSADRRQGSGKPYLFIANLSGPSLEVLDPNLGEIVTSARLEGLPESVRYIPSANEIWVAEPDREQIEVFKFVDGDLPKMERTTAISVLSGPVGLVFDRAAGLVYTNQPKIGLTSAYLASNRTFWRSWGNGCTEARGLALNAVNGYLFIACAEGKLVVTDPRRGGIQITSKAFGDDLHHLDFNQDTGHIYLPSGASAILGVFRLGEATPAPEVQGEYAPAESASPGGFVLVQLASADTSLNANCVTSDNRGNVYVCDPDRGKLLLVKDTVGTENK
ncbi:MAG TPA: hypothetical protein VJ436_02730 [Anaerolineales bacterium]|nr:hypothetical protein [Anaerolineales bacterium]